jgi:flagellar hook-associated protein 2
MSSITSGVGIFSGINSEQLINQLLQLDARPKTIYQKRIRDISLQQTALLDVNTRLSSLKSASTKFNTSQIFKTATTASSNADVLTATATAGAAPGTYRFTVDRLVATQQTVSRGFADATTSAVGITNLTLEPRQALLSRDTPLSQLNGGQGVQRGRIIVTDSAGTVTNVDLSRVGTVTEVMTAISDATGGKVTATVDGDRLVMADGAGGSGRLKIENVTGGTTATSLGIAGTAAATGSAGRINGTMINTVGGATSLSTLNDGRGVFISRTGGTSTPDFSIITRSGEAINIDIGDMYENRVPDGGGAAVLTKVKSAVTDLQGVVDRINTQARAGVTQKVSAAINSAGTGIELTDLTTPSGTSPVFSVVEINGNTTAADLGIKMTTTGGSLTGKRVQAAMNSVLLGSINGGRGLNGSGFGITTKDGQSFSITADPAGSLSDLMKQIGDETGGAVTMALNARGTGITLTDNTSGGGSFSVTLDGASAMNIVPQSSSVWGNDNLQMGYLSKNTKLSALPGGRTVGSGRFEIVTSYGERKTVNIGTDAQNIGDIISAINSAAPDVTASINDNGDGIVIKEKARGSGAGGQKIAIRDLSGTVARDLNLVGTASAVGSSNKVDGSFEKNIAFDSGDTLQQVTDKINAANGMAIATIVNDGSPSRPARLVLTSRATGSAGAFISDPGTFDLGLYQTSAAQDSRIFYGSDDPARALLFQSTTNTISGIASNLQITAKAVNVNPVSITVAQDTAAIETAINEMVTAFNDVVSKIDDLTKYDAETQKKGTLLGDPLVQQMRQNIFSIIQGNPIGVTGRYTTLAQVGVKVDRDNTMSLDSSKLRAALTEDPQAVADLFAARGATTVAAGTTPVLDRNGNPMTGITVRVTTSTSTITRQGIAERLAAEIDRFVKPTDGLITRSNKTLDDQVKAQTTKIADLDARIERRRTILQRQFLAMEESIGKLQSQSGAVGGIRALQ